MWGSVFGLTAGDVSQTTNSGKKFSGKKLAAFEIVALTASAACAIIIAWYLDLAGLVPFAVLSITITLNNFLASFILGPILLVLLYPRVKRWGLIWTDIMKKEDVAPGMGKNLGSILMIVGALGGLIVGVLVATGVVGQSATSYEGTTKAVAVWLSVLPFLILIVVASLMLSGREQFVEE